MSAPFAGNTDTGDRGFVRHTGPQAMAVALDALGHGPEAATVADIANRHLQETSPDVALETLFESCHQQLRGTRGVALCLARIDADAATLTWLSVGNIQGVRVSHDANGIPQYESLIMRGGVVGDRLPELRASRTPLVPGDMLVLATDGIGFGWYREYYPNVTVEALAGALLERHCHGNDDALVLVARYRGRDGAVTARGGNFPADT